MLGIFKVAFDLSENIFYGLEEKLDDSSSVSQPLIDAQLKSSPINIFIHNETSMERNLKYRSVSKHVFFYVLVFWKGIFEEMFQFENRTLGSFLKHL